MPQIKARHKHIRQTAKRTRRNRQFKDQIKYATRAALERVRSGDEQETQEALNRAYQAIDKATKAGVLHPRRAGRKKSVLARQAGTAQAASE